MTDVSFEAAARSRSEEWSSAKRDGSNLEVAH